MDPDDTLVTGAPRPRLGFVGLGWTGRARLTALTAAGAAEAAALCDPDPERLSAAAPEQPRAACFDAAEELLDEARRLKLDGVVVATPTASRAGLTAAALERGLAVLCQEPLAAGAAGCREAVAAARRADRLLGVDFTYRGLPGMPRAVRRVRRGVLGRVVHVHGVFHNAHRPDEAHRPDGAHRPDETWRRDAGAVGGGAFLDLGVHLLDLTLAMLGRPEIEGAAARCFHAGRPLAPPVIEVEDFAAVRFDFAGGASADLAASWCAHAGGDCVFRFEVFGTGGGLELVNVGGSACDFELAVREGRRRTVVARAGEADLAAAAIAWARRLARSPRFDPAAAATVAVAEAVERVYGRSGRGTAVQAPANGAEGPAAVRASGWPATSALMSA